MTGGRIDIVVEPNIVRAVALQELQHRNHRIAVGQTPASPRGGETRDMLDSIIGRIEAVALAHDMLSAGEQTSDVEFSEYLRTLCTSIEPSHRGIRIEVEDDGIGMKLPPEPGTGLKLVKGFAHQIGGVQYANVERGSRTELCFPIVLWLCHYQRRPVTAPLFAGTSSSLGRYCPTES